MVVKYRMQGPGLWLPYPQRHVWALQLLAGYCVRRV